MSTTSIEIHIQTIVCRRINHKLNKKYYGLFKVFTVAGKVSYKLQLPSGAKIHDVIHVSQLMRFHGQLPQNIPYT